MVLHDLLLPAHGNLLYLFLGIAVVCVCLGGIAPGILAVGLGAVVGAAETLAWGDLTDRELAALAVYIVVGVTVCALIPSLPFMRERLRTSEASLQLLLGRMPVVMWSTDRGLRITSSGGVGMSALGLSPQQATGSALLDFFSMESPQRAAVALRAHQRALEGKASTYQMEWKGRLFQTHIEPLRDGGGRICGTVAAALDSTEHHRVEREQALRHEIMRAFAESPSLLEGAHRLLAILGQALDWDAAVYWTADRETRRLRCSATWHRAGVVSPEFLKETESSAYRAEACIPGRAWMGRQDIWIANISTDLSFRRAEIAAADSLRGGLWLPLPEGSAVSGVLEFLNRSGRQPDSWMRALLSDVCRQLAEFSRRWRAEETTALLAAVLENTPDFVGVVDLAGRPMYVNRAGRRMIGLAVDDDIRRFRIGDFSPAWARKIILEQGIPSAVEYGVWEGEAALLNRRSGKETPVSQVILCHQRPDGSPEFLSTIARDITDRKTAEAQSRLSHRVLQTTGALVLVADGELNIRYASPSLYAVLGYSPSEVLGRKWWTCGVHPAAERRELLRYLTEVARGRLSARERPYETRMVHRDGSERWVLWQDSRGADGLVIRVGQDISEQKRMQQSLMQKAAQQEAVAALGRQALTTTDTSALLESAARLVASHLEAGFCCVLERMGEKGPVILRGLQGDGRVSTGTTLATEAEAGDALLRSAKRMLRLIGCESAESACTVGVAIPIRGEAGSLGALGVCRGNGGEFSNDQLHFVEAVANILSYAIQRRRA